MSNVIDSLTVTGLQRKRSRFTNQPILAWCHWHQNGKITTELRESLLSKGGPDMTSHKTLRLLETAVVEGTSALIHGLTVNQVLKNLASKVDQNTKIFTYLVTTAKTFSLLF